MTNSKFRNPAECQELVTSILRKRGLHKRGRPPRAHTLIDAILLLRIRGIPPGEIASELGCSPQYVSEQTRVLKVKSAPRRPVEHVEVAEGDLDDTPGKGGKAMIDLDQVVASLDEILTRPAREAYARGLVIAEDIRDVRNICRYLPGVFVGENPATWTDSVWGILRDVLDRKKSTRDHWQSRIAVKPR